MSTHALYYEHHTVQRGTYCIPFMQILGSSVFSKPEYKWTGNAFTPQSVATPQLAAESLIIVSFTVSSANMRPTELTNRQCHITSQQ